MRLRWATLAISVVLTTGLAAGSAASADETPTEPTTAVAVTDQSDDTTTTTATTIAPALSEAASAGSTSGRTMSVESPGEAVVMAERSGPALQLMEPPVAPTTTTIPPLSQLPANSGEGRRIVYSKTNQWVWLVEADGTIRKDHPVSGNRQWNLPRVGTYQVSSKSQYTCSIVQPSLCWRYMVRFARGPDATWRDNIGFHEIPTNTTTGNVIQGDGQLGQPLSAGCIRQSTPDAVVLWDWTPLGTTVVVLP